VPSLSDGRIEAERSRQMYKIFTDPIHGFINVPKGPILQLLDHAYVQRLRRIRQLGLAYTVFPGAEHSRFSHALGALGLMIKVLSSLKDKNTTITNPEHTGVLAAILLHDAGHGPFSHTLEHSLIQDFRHEMMTLALMKEINKSMDGELEPAIEIFTNQYKKKFLHQLISSQLDVDRLDYLKRDSFYTGVLEGYIGIDRIIKTMRVHKDNVVIERKGIYAVENYIMARHFMYMQVYLHKTVLSADKLLRAVIQRARDLVHDGYPLFFPSPALEYFIREYPSAKKGISKQCLRQFVMLDDNDILICLKYWLMDKDPVISDLCHRFLNRRFLRTTYYKEENNENIRQRMRENTAKSLKKSRMPFDDKTVGYYLFFDESENEAYQQKNDSIWILDDNETAVEFSKAADTRSVQALRAPVKKNYVVHLKDVVV
jgi:HD superfamily phosphohydrolase